MNFPINSAEQLKAAFGLDDLKNYEEFIAFKDGKPGFSIKRAYPEDIPFIAPVTKAGKPDTVAMIRVLYNPSDLPAEQLDMDKVPLWINIGVHNKYSYLHFGYDFDENDCPTAESLERSHNSPQPINLDFHKHFFYSHRDGTFLRHDEKKMSGAEVLETVYREHCDTTRETQRRRWRVIARFGCLADRMIHALVVVLRVLFRKKFDETRSPFQPYLREDVALLEAESLVIFGYKTTKNIILTYAVVVLIAYSIFYLSGLTRWPFFRSLWKDPILVLCLNLVALPLFEHLGPHIIRFLVNVFIRVRLWSIMRSPLYVYEGKKS
jgi:hypothetical protein